MSKKSVILKIHDRHRPSEIINIKMYLRAISLKCVEKFSDKIFFPFNAFLILNRCLNPLKSSGTGLALILSNSAFRISGFRVISSVNSDYFLKQY
jgi:hypothetical protein